MLAASSCTAPVLDTQLPGRSVFTGIIVKDVGDCENCRICGVYELNAKEHWIFCKECGESFHLSCAPKGPAVEHPSPHRVAPGLHPVWDYCCPECSSFDSENLSALTTAQCVNCGIAPQSEESRLFCNVCIGRKACPRCLFRYDNDDYGVMMIECNSCGSWSHAECEGFSSQTYDYISRNKHIHFHCVHCRYQLSEGPSSLQCIHCGMCSTPSAVLYPCTSSLDLQKKTLSSWTHQNCFQLPQPSTQPMEEQSSAYWRRGSISISIHDGGFRSLVLIRRFWSYVQPFRRVNYYVKLPLEKGFPLRDIEITAGDDLENPIHLEQLSVESLIVKWAGTWKDLKIAPTVEMFFGLRIVGVVLLNRLPTPQRSLALRPPSNLPRVQLQVSAAAPASPGSKVVKTPYRVKLKRPQLTPEVRGREEVKEEPSKLVQCARLLEYRRRLVIQTPFSPSPETDFRTHSRPVMEPASNTDLVLGNLNDYLEVRKSAVAGFGLFAKREIPGSALILEYCGEVISQAMADRREKYYSLVPRFSRDCYMFFLSKNRIIDATVKGNISRFINHSCAPNCEACTVYRNKRPHVMIYSLQRIKADEELTYDYRFSRSESGERAPCLCGALNCRRWID